MSILQRAQEGDAEAQFHFGNCFNQGEGVSQDKTEAAIWFRIAAMRGHAGAQFYLGKSYFTGEGVFQKAVEWWIESASQGYEPAQQALKDLNEN